MTRLKFKAADFTGIDMQESPTSSSRYGLSDVQAQRIADEANQLLDEWIAALADVGMAKWLSEEAADKRLQKWIDET